MNTCRDAIQRLIPLGFYYRELERFAKKCRNLSWIHSQKDYFSGKSSESFKLKSERPSIYRRALANGIVEILSLYRSAVLQVEQKLLSDPLPILATITEGLNKVLYAPLFCKFIFLHFMCKFYFLRECATRTNASSYN